MGVAMPDADLLTLCFLRRLISGCNDSCLHSSTAWSLLHFLKTLDRGARRRLLFQPNGMDKSCDESAVLALLATVQNGSDNHGRAVAEWLCRAPHRENLLHAAGCAANALASDGLFLTPVFSTPPASAPPVLTCVSAAQGSNAHSVNSLRSV